MLTPGELGILAGKAEAMLGAAAQLDRMLAGEYATVVAKFEAGEIVVKRFQSFVTLEIETIQNDFGYTNQRVVCESAEEVYEDLNFYFGMHADLDAIEWVARPAICLH